MCSLLCYFRFSESVVLQPVETRQTKSFGRDTFVVGSDDSLYCYLFRTSSPACCPASSPATASPAPASSPTPATGAAQVSEIDLQLGCDVVGWFAEVVVAGLIGVGLQMRTYFRH